MPDQPDNAALLRRQPLIQLDLLGAASIASGWPVRQSARSKRMAARVFRDGRVEIVVPLRARPAQIAQFVAEHRPWIERTQQRARLAAPTPLAADRRLPVESLTLAATGERWLIEHRQPAGRARLGVTTSLPPNANGDLQPAAFTGRLILQARVADQDGVRAILIDWLRERMRSVGATLLPPLAGSMNVDFSALRVGCQRSRWGSCSRNGTVSLNCCLLFQRPEVLRYLLVHELAHRRHMNHGAEFWRLVEKHEPHWRSLDKELSAGWRQVPAWVFARGEAGH